MTYKDKDFAAGSGVVDLERGRMAKGTMHPWQTDDSIDWNSWCDIQDPSYKSANRLIDELVDIVSKNGCLLLNVPPKANGEIPAAGEGTSARDGPMAEAQRRSHLWHAARGPSLAKGPRKVNEGHFGEEKTKDFTAQDIRFTTKGSMLYAICLGWPGEKLVDQVARSAQLLGSWGPECRLCVARLPGQESAC